MERLAADGRQFVGAVSGTVFRPRGFQFVFDRLTGKWVESLWNTDRPRLLGIADAVTGAMGATALRIHLSLGSFMTSPSTVSQSQLDGLDWFLGELDKRCYVILTMAHYDPATRPNGLGTFDYDGMSESARWDVQKAFWTAVASVGVYHDCVMGYDLANEPICSDAADWYTGAVGGLQFGLNIIKVLGGRTATTVATQWIQALAGAVRVNDPHHMISVGQLPYDAGGTGFAISTIGPLTDLNYISLHAYPASGNVSGAVTTVNTFYGAIGAKPLYLEESGSLSAADWQAFVTQTRGKVAGYSIYFGGKLPADCDLGVPAELLDYATYLADAAAAPLNPPGRPPNLVPDGDTKAQFAQVPAWSVLNGKLDQVAPAAPSLSTRIEQRAPGKVSEMSLTSLQLGAREQVVGLRLWHFTEVAAQALLADPSADNKNQWTLTGGATAAACLAGKSAALPNAPSLTSYISSATLGQQAIVNFPTTTLGGSRGRKMRLWYYAQNTDAAETVEVALLTSIGVRASTVLPAGSAAAWRYLEMNSSPTVYELSSAQASFKVTTAGSTAARVYAAFLEVHLEETAWPYGSVVLNDGVNSVTLTSTPFYGEAAPRWRVADYVGSATQAVLDGLKIAVNSPYLITLAYPGVACYAAYVEPLLRDGGGWTRKVVQAGIDPAFQSATTAHRDGSVYTVSGAGPYTPSSDDEAAALRRDFWRSAAGRFRRRFS